MKVIRGKAKIYLMRSDLICDDASFGLLSFYVFRVQSFPEQSILAAICL